MEILFNKTMFKNNKNLLFYLLYLLLNLAGVLIVLGLINYYLHGEIFTTIYCDGKDPLDALVLTDPEKLNHLKDLQNLRHDVLEPRNGYNITDPKIFFRMLLSDHWDGQYYFEHWENFRIGGHINCPGTVTNCPGNVTKCYVYAIKLNNKLYSVHPYLMELIYVKNNIWTNIISSK